MALIKSWEILSESDLCQNNCGENDLGFYNVSLSRRKEENWVFSRGKVGKTGYINVTHNLKNHEIVNISSEN